MMEQDIYILNIDLDTYQFKQISFFRVNRAFYSPKVFFVKNVDDARTVVSGEHTTQASAYLIKTLKTLSDPFYSALSYSNNFNISLPSNKLSVAQTHTLSTIQNSCSYMYFKTYLIVGNENVYSPRGHGILIEDNRTKEKELILIDLVANKIDDVVGLPY